MPTTRTINCTNGSIKDGSKTVTCQTSDKDCFPDSYTYCKKLSTSQIVVLAAIGVAGLCVLGLVNWILSKLPLIGGLLKLVINLITLGIIAVVVYMVYENYKAKPKTFRIPNNKCCRATSK